MRIKQLEHFLDVAKTGSVNKSATRLFISPQGLSRSISALESEFNMALFERSSKGMALTEEGRAFRSAAERLVAADREFTESVRKISRHGCDFGIDVLNLVVTPFFTGVETFLPMLRRLKVSFPETVVKVSEKEPKELLAQARGLDGEEADSTVMLGVFPDYWMERLQGDPSIELTVLNTMPMVVLASKGHPISSCKSISRKKLAQEKIVCFKGEMMQEVVHHLLDEHGGPDFLFKGDIRNMLEFYPDAVSVFPDCRFGLKADSLAKVALEEPLDVMVVAITAPGRSSGLDEVVRGIRACLES